MAVEEPRKLTRSEQKALRQQAKATLAASQPAEAQPGEAQPEKGGQAKHPTRRERKLLAKQQKEARELLAQPLAAKSEPVAAEEDTKPKEKLTRSQKRALKEAARAAAAPKHITFEEKESSGANPLDRPPNPNGVGGMFGKKFAPLGVNSQGQPIRKRRKKTRSKQKNMRKDTRTDEQKAKAKERRASVEKAQAADDAPGPTQAKEPEATPSAAATPTPAQTQQTAPAPAPAPAPPPGESSDADARRTKRQRMLGDYIAEAFAGQGKKPRKSSKHTNATTSSAPTKASPEPDHTPLDSPVAGKDYSRKAFSILPSPTTRFKGSLVSPKKGLGLQDNLGLVMEQPEASAEKAASAVQAAAERGYDECITRLDTLANRYGSVFKPDLGWTSLPTSAIAGVE